MLVAAGKALMLKSSTRLGLCCVLLLLLTACSTTPPKVNSEQETRLQQISQHLDHAFVNSRVDVRLQADHIRLILPSHYLFNRKGVIYAYMQRYLQQIASTAIANGYQKINILGYTDHSGGIASNQNLSTGWANKVKKYLVQQGIVNDKITAAGRGEFFPIASNYTFAGKLKNRRVEILLYLQH